MNGHWNVMVILGPILILFGIFMTDVTGRARGAPLYPAPLRFRIILILSGVFMIVFGLYQRFHE
jgi:hypothetical protein